MSAVWAPNGAVCRPAGVNARRLADQLLELGDRYPVVALPAVLLAAR